MSAATAAVRTALLSPPFTELSYSLPDYLPPEAFFVGQRVVVPLGKSRRAGVISAFERQAAGAESFTLKPLIWPLDREPLLSPAYLDLARTLAGRHADELGRILGSILPAGLRTPAPRLLFFTEDGTTNLVPADLARLPEDRLRALGDLWMAGRAEVRRPGAGPLDALLYSPASDPPWPVRPAAKARLAVLEFLLEKGSASRRTLLNALGKKAGATLTALTREGLVRAAPADPANLVDASGGPFRECLPAASDDDTCFILTQRQREIADELLCATGQGAQIRLLFGVTGSGKTALYLETARAVLASGRSVLLLAPEVALALKLHDTAEAALPPGLPPPDRRHLFHGYLGAASKERTFRLLAGDKSGRPRLLTGTRSALLLPLENIGLIVMDEEHDASFKQDEGFINYQAKEVAWYRANREGALLLLGSATPDLKSFYAARQGRIPLHTLTERFGAGLPEARLVPLSPGKDNSLLAPDSVAALNEVVRRGEQAVILLNRRGYAPVVYCRDCGKTLRCPQCDISLAYHKGREKLVCHYCGRSTVFPSPCPSCGNLHFLPLGEGTEKLEENLETLLPPGAGVLRLDRDSTRRPGRVEAILSAFARKEAAVLVGTQMLSKGHHFPDVTLAVIADADLGLNLPDYRAAERTFQLILQASGRSGRGGKSGQVLIQTRDPRHYCWDYVIRADYEGFFERELELRRRRLYPPFTRLALIRISHEAGLIEGAEAATALGRSMRQKAKDLGIIMLGPAPAPLPLLKGRVRRHCLLKGDDWQSFRLLYKFAVETAKGGALTLRLDLDPVNML
ncbi:MAG: primosomal protein N' [Desulfovibrio sp.]|jgi:primosomal protein N' (replication factor Y)|nr:primosomal protein N' [Desulfovibrio sp.]